MLGISEFFGTESVRKVLQRFLKPEVVLCIIIRSADGEIIKPTAASESFLVENGPCISHF